MMNILKKIGLSFVFLLTIHSQSNAQILLNPIIDSIPMRDSKKLAADIYLPNLTDTFPVILVMTPYGRIAYRLGLPLGVKKDIDSSKYAFVTVDWRGRFGSIAAGPPGNNGEDGYDVIDWISQQPWCTGKIGTWGPSALGRIQYMTARENHPNHTCAVPLVAASQYSYPEYFPGGAARKEYIDQLDALGFGLSTILYSNTVYNTTWIFAEGLNLYPEKIKTPMLMIGGWYDHNVEVMIELFEYLKTQSPDSTHHRMLFGPWVHGGSGIAQVGTSTAGELSYPAATGWNDSLALVFLDYWLRDIPNGWQNSPNIQYFQMGDDTWMQTPLWPPAGLMQDTLFLAENGGLSSLKPNNSTGETVIPYDPRNPSPTWGGPTLRSDQEQGPYDISDTIESRTDAAIFTTDILGHDVVVKGKIALNLFVSSDKKDTDFAIRITDVYPDGRSMLVNDQIFRMRFRDGFKATDTSVMVPGTIYPITIEMPNTALTFKAGHRIRVVITSSNYPRFDNNLNNGGTMYVPGDTLIAMNTVHHNNLQLSHILLPLTSPFTGIEPTEKSEHSIHAWPIPAHDLLNIQTGGIYGFAQIDLIGLNGQKFYSKILEISDQQAIQIPVKTIPNGIYSLSIMAGAKILTKKIAVLHP